MDTAAILDDLTFAKGLPREALAAANGRRAELTPRFLAEIDGWLASGPEDRAAPSPLFYIFHLLGSWRETAAYRPLARLLRAPSDDVDTILSEAMTETAYRVMASVFDGDPAPLYQIIHDSQADEYVRARSFDTLAMLVHWGKLDRDEVVRFLAEAYDSLRPQGVNFVWEGWQGAIALLGLVEKKEQVRSAFARGFIDETWMAFENFERDLERALESPDQVFDGPHNLYQPIGDVVAELEGWYFASDAYLAELEANAETGTETEAAYAAIGSLFNSDRDRLPAQPYVNPEKVGRNEPCPCGSGRKFKKCCGG